MPEQRELDIVAFFKALTEDFNDNSQCDFCWFFAAPLGTLSANTQQTPEGAECCVHVLITRIEKSTVKGYNNTTTYLNSHFDDHSFTVLFVMPTTLGQNEHTEIKNHPEEEGKWSSIYNPLKECLSDTDVLDFCKHLGYDVRVTSWRMTTVSNYLDKNFTGWQIAGTFREQKV